MVAALLEGLDVKEAKSAIMKVVIVLQSWRRWYKCIANVWQKRGKSAARW